LHCILVAAVIFFWPPVPCSAQPDEAPPRDEIGKLEMQRIRLYWGIDRGGISSLIRNAAIQDELGMTKNQVERLQELKKDEDMAVGKAQSALGNGRGGASMERIGAVTKEIRDEYRANALEVLDKNQRKRATEIGLQVMGPLAVAWPEIKEELLIGPDQGEFLGKVIEDYDRRKSDLTRAYLAAVKQRAQARDARAHEAAQEAIDKTEAQLIKVEDEAVKALSKLLSRTQKNRFNRLLGEPFDLTALLPPGSPKQEKSAEAKASPE
jgi:hypothetical protein